MLAHRKDVIISYRDYYVKLENNNLHHVRVGLTMEDVMREQMGDDVGDILLRLGIAFMWSFYTLFAYEITSERMRK